MLVGEFDNGRYILSVRSADQDQARRSTSGIEDGAVVLELFALTFSVVQRALKSLSQFDPRNLLVLAIEFRLEGLFV